MCAFSRAFSQTASTAGLMFHMCRFVCVNAMLVE